MDIFLSLPHVDIDLKGWADLFASKGLGIGSMVAPIWPPSGGAIRIDTAGDPETWSKDPVGNQKKNAETLSAGTVACFPTL